MNSLTTFMKMRYYFCSHGNKQRQLKYYLKIYMCITQNVVNNVIGKDNLTQDFEIAKIFLSNW